MRFSEAMKVRTDEELLGIVGGPAEDWEPDAVDAANIEIDRRGIRVPAAHPYRDGPLPVAPKDEGPPLATSMKVFAFLIGLCFLIFGIVLGLLTMSYCSKQGRARQGRELMIWTAAGFVLFLVLVSFWQFVTAPVPRGIS